MASKVTTPSLSILVASLHSVFVQSIWSIGHTSNYMWLDFEKSPIAHNDKYLNICNSILNYISRMHGAASMQFSTIVQSSKVFSSSTFQWIASRIVHHFRYFSSIYTPNACTGMVGGGGGSHRSNGLKHMKELDLQMGWDETLLCSKYHKR